MNIEAAKDTAAREGGYSMETDNLEEVVRLVFPHLQPRAMPPSGSFADANAPADGVIMMTLIDVLCVPVCICV